MCVAIYTQGQLTKGTMKNTNSNYKDDENIPVYCYVCEKNTDETTIIFNEDKRFHGFTYIEDVICEDCK